LTGLEHFPQGYFTGPGLVEMSPDSKRIKNALKKRHNIEWNIVLISF
jgi:hypothetical protein